MSLSTAPIVKSSHIFAGTYSIFVKKCPGPSLLMPDLDIGEKIRRAVIK